MMVYFEEKSEFDDLKKQMHEELSNLIREKATNTPLNLSSPNKTNSPKVRTYYLDQSIDGDSLLSFNNEKDLSSRVQSPFSEEIGKSNKRNSLHQPLSCATTTSNPVLVPPVSDTLLSGKSTLKLTSPRLIFDPYSPQQQQQHNKEANEQRKDEMHSAVSNLNLAVPKGCC
jgi:hypothetical protein